jgi:hypothetical protein
MYIPNIPVNKLKSWSRSIYLQIDNRIVLLLLLSFYYYCYYLLLIS